MPDEASQMFERAIEEGVRQGIERSGLDGRIEDLYRHGQLLGYIEACRHCWGRFQIKRGCAGSSTRSAKRQISSLPNMAGPFCRRRSRREARGPMPDGERSILPRRGADG